MRPKEVFSIAAAALAAVLALAPASVFLLAWVQFIPLFMLSEAGPGKRFLRYFFYGFIFNLMMLYWIPRVMVRYGNTSWPLGISGLFALAAFLAVLYGLFGLAAGPWLNRIRTCRAALFFVPALWVSKDLVLEKIFGGFPWGLTGYSQYNNLLFLQWAQIGGIHLLTFLVILGNILLLRVAAKRGRAWLLVLAVIPLLHAAGWLMLRVHLERLQVLPLENAAIVQPNVTPDDHLRFGSIDLALEKLLEESRTLVRQGASLIIWPEYTIPVYPLQDYRYGDIFDRFALDEVPLLAGFTDLQGLDRIYNSVILFYPGGRSKYDKVRLTPFGEYIPFRRLLFFVRRITDEIGDFTPGAKATNLYLNDLVIAPPICYEIIYPGLVNSFVRKGAQVIITTSNDSWFGRTAAPYQHLSMAVLRAVENRRYVLRSTSNGVSALIESSGIIRRRSAYGRQDAFLAPFHRLSGKTFFSSVGFLFPYLCVLFSLLIPGKKLLSFLWRAAK